MTITKNPTLSYLIEAGRWDEAYMSLLNARSPHGRRFVLFGRPLLSVLCETGAPPKLIDMAASLFPSDIIAHNALHKVICRNSEDTPKVVKILLKHLADHLGCNQKFKQALLHRGPLYRLAQLPATGHGDTGPIIIPSVVPTRNGGEHNALEAACICGCSVETLQAFIEANPEALFETSQQHTYCSINEDGRWISKQGTTPLATLWHRERISLFQLLNRPKLEAMDEEQIQKAEESKSWKRLKYVIMETYFAAKSCSKKARLAIHSKEDFLLHALVESFDVDDGLLFKFSIQLCQKECAFVRDEGWDTPLHKLLRADTRHESFSKAVKAILRLAPESAGLKTKQDQYPLNMATGKLEWVDGLAQLVDAFPPAVDSAIAISPKRQPVYPFLFAALKGTSITTVFRLLRIRPDLLDLAGMEQKRTTGCTKRRRRHMRTHHDDPDLLRGRMWRLPRSKARPSAPRAAVSKDFLRL